MLNDLLYKMRGAGNWPKVDGTIFSCTWGDPTTANAGGGGLGWYTVTFGYRVDGEYYGGDFTVFGSEVSEAPYREGDKLVVHYNPRHPEKNFHEGTRFISAKTQHILTFIIITVVVLAIDLLRMR